MFWQRDIYTLLKGNKMVREVYEDHFINYLSLYDFIYVTCKKINKMVAPQCGLGHFKIVFIVFIVWFSK